MSKKKELTEEMRSERKSKIIFFVVLVIAFVAGTVGGFVSSAVGDIMSLGNVAESLMDIVNSEAYYIGAVVIVFAGIIAFVLYHQSRKAYENWDEEDDEAMDKIEEKLSLALIVINGSVIFTYIFSTIGVGQLSNYFAEGNYPLVKAGILIAGILLATTLMMVVNVKIVNFEKEMNPEKKGSVYDMNFQKKWMESSDEAEKLVTYKCGFAAYKSVNIVCLVLWLVCMFGMEIWNWDNIPVLMVGAIWLTAYISYSKEALKLSKHAKKIQE